MEQPDAVQLQVQQQAHRWVMCCRGEGRLGTYVLEDSALSSDAPFAREPRHGPCRLFPNNKRWYDTIAARAAAQRGVQVLADARRALTDDRARDLLFGAGQYQRR